MTPDEAIETLREAVSRARWSPFAEDLSENVDRKREALDAVSVLARELERLNAAWQEAEHPFDKSEYDAMYDDLHAALAESERLREALRPALTYIEYFVPFDEALTDGFDVDAWLVAARAALAGREQPGEGAKTKPANPTNPGIHERRGLW